MYKINGYYYLFAAQGGTVYTHQEVVARSKTLDELSFETEPDGPFITNFDTPYLEIQKQGHGALVDTPSGEWYYASADVHGLMKISAALTHVVTVLLDVRQRFRKYTGMKKAGLVLKAATAERFL